MANRTVASKAKKSSESRLSDAEAIRLSKDGFMSISEAMDFLGIKKTKLNELRKQGVIPFLRQGSRPKIPRLAVIEYCADLLQKVN